MKTTAAAAAPYQKATESQARSLIRHPEQADKLKCGRILKNRQICAELAAVALTNDIDLGTRQLCWCAQMRMSSYLIVRMH